MPSQYEINQLEKEESWRMFRIIGEFVEGFDALSRITPAVTVFGSARTRPENSPTTLPRPSAARSPRPASRSSPAAGRA